MKLNKHVGWNKRVGRKMKKNQTACMLEKVLQKTKNMANFITNQFPGPKTMSKVEFSP